ncbi:MAG: glycosyltransferase family 4 protein [Anaerolineae bacterium]
MIRVCLVTGEYPPDEGGVADYTCCLAEALASHGAVVDILTTRRAPAARHDLPRAGSVAVHRVVPQWRWPVFMQLRQAVRSLAPDIVHIQYQTAAFGMHPAINAAPRWLRRFTPAKTAVTYHDLNVPYLFPKAGRVRRWVNLLPARHSHLTIATNAADFAALEAWGRAWELALVPIGSNIVDAPPDGYDRGAFRRANGLRDGSAALIYFGFLNASKGGRDLVDVLAALRAEGRDAALIMLGGRTGASDPTNAAYLARFEADVAQRGLADAVRWTGHVAPAEVSAWLHAADVAVLPYADGASYRRGSLLAALTHGVPIVTTRPADGGAAVAGAPVRRAEDGAGGEEPPAGAPRTNAAFTALPPLADGIAARLVAPGDARALADAVRGVLDDPILAARLRAGARDVAARFGWDAIAAEHLRLYRDVIDRWSPRPQSGLADGWDG